MKSEWIAITDETPDHKEMILAFDAYYGEVFVSYYNIQEEFTRVGNDDFYVTHWMKLPEAPSREDVTRVFDKLEDTHVE